jgi:hypothetical protein
MTCRRTMTCRRMMIYTIFAMRRIGKTETTLVKGQSYRMRMTCVKRRICRTEKIYKRRRISIFLKNNPNERGGYILKNWNMRNCS